MSAKQNWITPTVKQTWAVSVFFLMKLTFGMAVGFTSCFLNAIKAPDSKIKMDLNTATWFVSSFSLSFMIGSALASILLPIYGRRPASIFATLPGLVGLMLSIISDDITSLFINRILTGVNVGGLSVIASCAIGEFSSPQNRDMYFNILTALLNIGSLIIHVIGNYVHWSVLNILINVPFVFCIFIIYTWPESPFWLAEKKKFEKSREAFYWLRGKSDESTREIEELLRAQKFKRIKKTFKEHFVDFFLKFKKPNFLKPFFIMLLMLILLELSGRHIFPSYAAQIVAHITGEGFDPFYFNVILDVLISLAGFLASYLIRVMKMRTLLFGTGFATFVTLILACLALYLNVNQYIPDKYSLVTLILFCTYFVLTNLGCTSVSILIPGLIFPLEHKVAGLLFGCYITSVSMTVTLKITPLVVAALQLYGAFSVLAVCLAITLLILYFILPETKDRTLLEIENYFTYGTFRDGEVLPTDDEYEHLETVNTKVNI